MREFDIEVIGAKPPRKTGGPLTPLRRRTGMMVRALLKRPRVLFAAAMVALVLFVGTPHAGWDYECRHPIRLGQQCRSVSYCAYYGIQGRRVVFPHNGESCKVMTFLPINWRRITRPNLP